MSLATHTLNEAVFDSETDAGRARSADERHRQSSARAAHDRWREAAPAVDAYAGRRRADVTVGDVDRVHLRAPA